MGTLVVGTLGTSKQGMTVTSPAAGAVTIGANQCGIFIGNTAPRKQQEKYGGVVRCLETIIEADGPVPASNFSTRSMKVGTALTAKGQITATDAAALPTIDEAEVHILWGSTFGGATGKKIGTVRFKTHVMWALNRYREQVGAKV